MPPWKSQRVQGQRQQQGGGTAASSISASPFRPAKSAHNLINGELPIELISSPSRGLDVSDSTRDLTNEATQTRYRTYISQRLKAHRDKFEPALNDVCKELFPLLLPAASSGSRWSAAGIEGGALDSLQAILLLVRRLREGCVAASRKDVFAIDVYALSTFLSLLVGDDIQLSSSLPRLLELVLSASAFVCNDVAQDIAVILGCESPPDTLALLEPDHLAALYLLWLIESGGQASRIGGAQRTSRGPSGAWLQERDRISRGLQEMKMHKCQWMTITEDIHDALVRTNHFQLRAILVKDELSTWQRALVRRSVERIRVEVWTTLTKAYLHAPLDGLLIDEGKGGDDWLERVLFIDMKVMPLQLLPTIRSRTPDAWDDSIDQLTATLDATTLEQDSSTIHLRASRLAAVLEAFQLPQSPSPDAIYKGPLNRWIGRKVLQAGGPAIKLR